MIWGLHPGMEKRFFSSSRMSTPVLSPTKPPIQWAEGDFSLVVMWPRHETDHSCHSPPDSAAVRMSGTIPSFFPFGIHKGKTLLFSFTEPKTWKFPTLLYIIILTALLMRDISFYKISDYIFPMMQTLQQYCKCTLFVEQNNFHTYSETVWGPFVISDDKQVNSHFKVVHSVHFLLSVHHFSWQINDVCWSKPIPAVQLSAAKAVTISSLMFLCSRKKVNLSI